MFHLIGSLATLAIAGAATLLGFWQARQFTVNKLRYVDAVHKAVVPILVGAAAFCLAVPVVALVPLVGTGTAILFGGAVGMGVASGARDIRRRIGAG